MRMRVLFLSLALFASSACARNPRPVSTVALADSVTPALLLPNRRFDLAYPAPLMQVGVQGWVFDTLAITAEGRVDPVNSRVESASHSAFLPDVQRSLGTLRFRPALQQHKPVASRIRIGFHFTLNDCDTTHAAHAITWPSDSTRGIITVMYCARNISGPIYSSDLPLVAHATLTGLYSIGSDWESPNGFIICSAASVRGTLPLVTGRGISIDTRKLTDWSLIDVPSGGRHYGNRFFVTWEGDIYGPPASEHLGINQYLFRPTRIIEAAAWAVKPCMSR